MEKLGEEAEKTSAMLFALQSQMTTHFLYNTIEYIENIGICYVVKKIELLSTALSGVFRYSLRQENIFVLFPAAAGGKCYESQLGEQERAMPGKGTSMLIHIKKIRCFFSTRCERLAGVGRDGSFQISSSAGRYTD